MGRSDSRLIRAVAFALHLLLIICAWLSPLWLDWKLIVLGVLALSVQYLIVGGCVLTFMETGKDKYQTFYYHHLVKLFPRLNKYYTYVVIRFVLPILIVGMALLLQRHVGLEPLVRLF